MLRKIVIKNYRTFENFQMEFDEGLSILVGDNDAGKSTLLEAMQLPITGRARDTSLAPGFSPYLFNIAATLAYVEGLQRGEKPEPPELIIDLFLAETPATARLAGTNNSLREDSPGLRIKAAFDPTFSVEYEAFIAAPDTVKLVPTEYYAVEWLDFAGNRVTSRSIPVDLSFIDASTIRLHSGVDYYLQGIIRNHLDHNERVELSRAYRCLRQDFAENPSVAAVNEKLSEEQGDVSDRDLSLAIDISQRHSWESSLVPHLDDLPFQFTGGGEQSKLKILLALNRRADDSHVILVEEPENNQSFSSLNMLIAKIAEKCAGKQVLITTHSSYVLNKLGLTNLVLLGPGVETGRRLSELSKDTQAYFKRLSGYDTLRLVLAKRVILVEGDSDELIVQRAYMDVHGKRPIEDGIDVIDVNGVTAKRFLDIAILLRRTAAVVTDNDGKRAEDVIADKFADYSSEDFISIHVGKDPAQRTLEPQLLAANSRSVLNSIFGTKFDDDAALLTHMKNNKTPCALKIFESAITITMPEYIRDAVA